MPDPLASTSVQDRKRLLELYPIAALKAQWPKQQGMKGELCFELATNASSDEIVRFADNFLGCCKQHVFVYSHNLNLKNLAEFALPDAEIVTSVRQVGGQFANFLYLVKFAYNVVLRDPLEEAELKFLWPVRLDFTPQHLAVRFVVLEKNIATYFEGRSYYISRKSIEEKAILKAIEDSMSGALEITDLHQGIKTLWDDGFIDSPRAKFKKAYSTTDEAMDENRLIKEHDPDLYEVIKESPLFNTWFQVIPDKGLNVTAFTVDPTKGIIGFPRYSDNKGDTDELIAQILTNN